MGLPLIEDLCEALDVGPIDLCLVFPGGVEICAFTDSMPPDLYGMVRQGLAQASAALAPLAPIFLIIETIVAVKECIDAIPDVIGPPPNPGALVECARNLAALLERLLALAPPASIFATIVTILDFIIAHLQAIVNELNAIIALVDRITSAKLINATGLLAAIDCGEASQQVQMDNLTRAFASINSLIELINSLTKPFGLPELPSFAGGLGDDPAAAIQPLEDGIDALREIRDLIPVSSVNGFV